VLRRRLTDASWPRSAIVAEAKAAGIPEDAIDSAALRLKVY